MRYSNWSGSGDFYVMGAYSKPAVCHEARRYATGGDHRVRSSLSFAGRRAVRTFLSRVVGGCIAVPAIGIILLLVLLDWITGWTPMRRPS